MWATMPWLGCDSSDCSLCTAALPPKNASSHSSIPPDAMLASVLETLSNPRIAEHGLRPSSKQGLKPSSSCDPLFAGEQVPPVKLPSVIASTGIASLSQETPPSTPSAADAAGSSNIFASHAVTSQTACSAPHSTEHTATQAGFQEASGSGIQALGFAFSLEANTSTVSRRRRTRRRYSLDEDARDDREVKRKAVGQVTAGSLALCRP